MHGGMPGEPEGNESGLPGDAQNSQNLEQRINVIKAHLIATIIMEKTRSLKKKQKKKVKALCDKVLFDEMFDDAEGEFTKEKKENIIQRL